MLSTANHNGVQLPSTDDGLATWLNGDGTITIEQPDGARRILNLEVCGPTVLMVDTVHHIPQRNESAGTRTALLHTEEEATVINGDLFTGTTLALAGVLSAAAQGMITVAHSGDELRWELKK